jgi:transposase
LHGRFRLSDRDISTLLTLPFGLLEMGSTAHLQQTVSTALAPLYAEAKAAVATAAVANVDETSWKVSGKHHWLWVAVTTHAMVFHLDPSRGAKVLPTVIGPAFAGIVGLDWGRMYNGIPPDRRQLCWAHLIHNLRRLADHSAAFAGWAEPLLTHAHDLCTHWHALRAGTMTRTMLGTALVPIHTAFQRALHVGAERGDGIASFYRDVLPRWNVLWTFSTTPGVELTNNAAERALRPAVIWRKSCFGTQSATGSMFVARMPTVSTTAHQHGRNVRPPAHHRRCPCAVFWHAPSSAPTPYLAVGL